LQTRQAKTRSPHCARRASARDLPALAVFDVGVRVLDEQAAEHALVVAEIGLDAAALAVDEDARALLACQRGERVVVVVRREEHLDELVGELLAERPSTSRFSTTMPPYAEVGSEASAFSYASSTVAPIATPQGFACLTITHAAARTRARAGARQRDR
jgi:hypothetical protein